MEKVAIRVNQTISSWNNNAGKKNTGLICLISFWKEKPMVSRDNNFGNFMLAISMGRREVNEDPSLITPPLISLSSAFNNRHCSQSRHYFCFWRSFSAKGSLLQTIQPVTETTLASLRLHEHHTSVMNTMAFMGVSTCSRPWRHHISWVPVPGTEPQAGIPTQLPLAAGSSLSCPKVWAAYRGTWKCRQ